MPNVFGTVTADLPEIDGCRVLTRMKAFVVPQGIAPTLEHVFRDASGNALDIDRLCGGPLYPYPGPIPIPVSPGSETSVSASESSGSESSQSASQAADCSVVLRLKEAIAPAGSGNRVWQFPGTIVAPRDGLVRFPVAAKAVERAGIYEMSMALLDADDNPRHVENPFLWVEHSLFGPRTRRCMTGPPNLQEVRQAIIDSHSAENLLLDALEFADDQILHAMLRPVRLWNELPPPIDLCFDSRTFPFKEAWLKGTAAQLFLAAAHNYRRNHLPYQAGGVAIADKDKEEVYAKAGTALFEEYRTFVLAKKYQFNSQSFRGWMGSTYGGL